MRKKARSNPKASIARKSLVERGIPRAVAAGFVLHEDLGDLGMPDRFSGLVGQQILLGDVSDILGFRILCEQMVEGLILARAILLGNRQPPFLGVVELRIDVENDAPEGKNPVTDD